MRRCHFNPLPPHGGRRSLFRRTVGKAVISIHSLRMEGDFRSIHQHPSGAYFNPLPPHGGRRFWALSRSVPTTFQSTPSAWRETRHNFRSSTSTAFQSTPSAWRETRHNFRSSTSTAFQSTPSAWRETDYMDSYDEGTATFQSTPSAWRETQFPEKWA